MLREPTAPSLHMGLCIFGYAGTVVSWEYSFMERGRGTKAVEHENAEAKW